MHYPISKAAYKELSARVSAGKTTEDVMTAINAHPRLLSCLDGHYYKGYLKWMILRAVELAKSVDDAMTVYCAEVVERKSEQELALDKALSLCKFTQDVQYVLIHVSGRISLLFDEEERFAKIFKRGHELPHHVVWRTLGWRKSGGNDRTEIIEQS